MSQPDRPCCRPGGRASLRRALANGESAMHAIATHRRAKRVTSTRARARCAARARARSGKSRCRAPPQVYVPHLPPHDRDAFGRSSAARRRRPFHFLLLHPQTGGLVLRTLFCAAAAVLAFAPAASAQREVTGRVTVIGSGEPIADASVGVVGIPVGARTNVRGEYRLRVPDGEVTLATRMIGYKRQTARVAAGQTTVNFELEKDVLQLEAITVTGAATTMERRNATSSVSQVSADQLERVPAVSIENALQGKILGASINMNNGAPGGGGQIQIRGASSLIGKIDPLYVIDGVIVSNDVRSNSQRFITNSLNSGEENGTNRLADINPADIESVEVLKGSVASAIYGSQATNGVVVITTKRGRSGSPRFNLTQRIGTFQLIRDKGLRHYANVDQLLTSSQVAGQ